MRRHKLPTPNLNRLYVPDEHLSKPPWQTWCPMIVQRDIVPIEIR